MELPYFALPDKGGARVFGHGATRDEDQGDDDDDDGGDRAAKNDEEPCWDRLFLGEWESSVEGGFVSFNLVLRLNATGHTTVQQLPNSPLRTAALTKAAAILGKK